VAETAAPNATVPAGRFVDHRDCLTLCPLGRSGAGGRKRVAYRPLAELDRAVCR